MLLAAKHFLSIHIVLHTHLLQIRAKHLQVVHGLNIETFFHFCEWNCHRPECHQQPCRQVHDYSSAILPTKRHFLYQAS